MTKHISYVLGTRPEIIKLSPLLRRSVQDNIPFHLIHSGQHYSQELDAIFFTQCALPMPNVNLHIGSGSHAETISKMMIGFEKIWQENRPAVVVVQGDTNTVFAAAFVAHRLQIPVAHVEAGLRSFDRTMPEESNRVMVDHISDRLYVPTNAQRENLLQEGIQEAYIQITGNTIQDAIQENMPIALKMELPAEIRAIDRSNYAIITLHRPALVDNPILLATVLRTIDTALRSRNMIGIFLVHPRTQKIISNIQFTAIVCCTPVGYFEMLQLLRDATMVCTDSGGLQEEAAILQIPCVTIRENTERPETMAAGGNYLVGFDVEKITHIITTLDSANIHWQPVYTIDNPTETILSDLTTRYL